MSELDGFREAVRQIGAQPGLSIGQVIEATRSDWKRERKTHGLSWLEWKTECLRMYRQAILEWEIEIVAELDLSRRRRRSRNAA